MLTITDYADLLAKLRLPQMIVVEGARCTGRAELVRMLRTDMPECCTYEPLQPRSGRVGSDGNMRAAPADLELQQSSFWILDLVRQNPDLRVILDRGLPSSLHYDGRHKVREAVWQLSLAAVGGVLVLLDPDLSCHRRRIAKAGKSPELNVILAERRVLGSLVADMVDVERVRFAPEKF